LDTVDDLRAGIGLRGYAQRDPLVEYKREAFDLFERLMANIDAEVVRRIYRVAVDNQAPIAIAPQPVVDLDRALEQHDEALDEQQLMEEIGQLMPEVEKISKDTKVKVEGSSNDEAYSTQEHHRQHEDGTITGSSAGGDEGTNGASGTKVTIERGGEVIAQETYGAQGQLQKVHGKMGRNDPCWCGKTKQDGTPVKYKHCHYPN
jgi:preprotein translocase subunit SecA